MNYSNLSVSEIISLADKLKDIIESSRNMSVNTALENLKNALNDYSNNPQHSDIASALIMDKIVEMANEVNNELKQRLLEGRGVIARLNKFSDDFMMEEEIHPHRYFIGLEVTEENVHIDWNTWYHEPNEDYFFIRKDGKKEIPDEDLLSESPHEWLVKYLGNGLYEEDLRVELTDEEYDEGFDE